MVYPDEKKTYTHIDRSPDKAAYDAAAEVFERLSNIAPVKDDCNSVLGVRFDSDGQELFDQWYIKNENKIRADDMHPAIASHFGKYGSLVATLALITNEIEVGNAQTITKQSVEKALKWAGYLESHALRIYGDAASPEIYAAELILNKKSDLPDGFTKRELSRKQWAGLTNSTLIDEALAELVECNYLSKKTSTTKGKTKTSFHWNPNI